MFDLKTLRIDSVEDVRGTFLILLLLISKTKTKSKN